MQNAIAAFSNNPSHSLSVIRLCKFAFHWTRLYTFQQRCLDRIDSINLRIDNCNNKIWIISFLRETGIPMEKRNALRNYCRIIQVSSPPTHSTSLTYSWFEKQLQTFSEIRINFCLCAVQGRWIFAFPIIAIHIDGDGLAARFNATDVDSAAISLLLHILKSTQQIKINKIKYPFENDKDLLL